MRQSKIRCNAIGVGQIVASIVHVVVYHLPLGLCNEDLFRDCSILPT